MTSKRVAVVVLAMLVAAGPIWAEPQGKAQPQGKRESQDNRASQPTVALAPRQALPKRALVQRPAGESQLVVKFKDQLKMRANPDRSLRSNSAVALTEVNAVRDQFGLQFKPLFRKTEADLTAFEKRVADYSGKAQPDLAGAMYVEGNADTLQAAANALLSLESVEFAYFHVPPVPFGGTGPPPCGDAMAGSCQVAHPNPNCDDAACCELVGDLNPFCTDPDVGVWDELCVMLANAFCMPVPPYDRCAAPPFTGSCFEEHGGGCNIPACCYAVCGLDPFCCEVSWDLLCVELAEDQEDVCIGVPGGGPTPDFTALQGYLRPVPYSILDPGAFADPPAPTLLTGLCGEALIANDPDTFIPGYDGRGYYLFATIDPGTGLPLLIDNPALPVPERYEGLYGMSRELFEVYDVGQTDPPGSNNVDDLVFNGRGKGVRVAVIEWGCFPDHEDLDVLVEPGQTLINILDISHADHATACLGIINAKDNGDGVIGIAPDAQAWFFPMTSIEEGGREPEAFLNCYNTLEPGDIVSCSFGPPPGNINNVEMNWMLMRMGSDLGVTTCIAAGNSCFEVGDLPNEDFGDSGAVVVGASLPGFPYCRIPFSNHHEDATAIVSKTVHVSGWGTCMTTCGGDAGLFFPNDNWNRSYTATFGGTSAACPMVAGAAACIQGLAKQFYGIPLPPSNLRSVLSVGTPQCNIPVPEDIPAYPGNPACGPDIDPDEPPNQIGPQTNTREAGATLINQQSAGFPDSPLIDDILIIRGEHVYGNHFSIKASDNSYFVVNSLFTPVKHEPPFVGPPGEVVYFAAGQTVDLMVEAHSNIKQSNAMLVTTEIPLPAPLALMILEMYSWELNKWTFVNFELLDETVPTPELLTHEITDAQPFIHPESLDVLIRVYILTLGGEPDFGAGEGGSPEGGWPLRVDWINLQVADGFGFFTPGGPGGVDP
ncbi:MAG: S8 family serine peptidase [Phycisphaerales bacterium]|nr:S8 family serine peptidase [Phycisphaerales bacterium]MCI0631702.1 S8 family serine peptidase [Phycisphaerales bacterium]MCI0675358.1 S8 family serine peptidase [Phycisphaerales bacterium]